uniref:Uncharacterized protein n=1 Tax=Mesocestoides corti TaxID=53468 RepID=A0A5K3F9F3_MESCO
MIIERAKNKIRRCLTRNDFQTGVRSFQIVGNNNGNWEGRLLSNFSGPSSNNSQKYSCELRNILLHLFLVETFETFEKKTRLYGLGPIRIVKFVLEFDTETTSTGDIVISNSAPYSEERLSFPTSTEYRNSSDIFKWLKIFIDSYC